MRDAADDVKDIEKQERTEKELRVAEMETNKAMCAPEKPPAASVVRAEIHLSLCALRSMFGAAGIC